jgi:fatty acid desaturase
METVARDTNTAALPLRVFQYSAWDAVLVLLAAAQGVLLVTMPGVLIIAIGLWWNSNTISHNFIHNPFFRSRPLNQIFAAYLSVLLGFPHALWRTRHLAHHAETHHAETARRIEWSGVLITQAVLVLFLWVLLGTFNSMFFLTVYLPAWALGLGLCAVQGHYEHDRGVTSCYGAVYNLLFFNDGFHAEHHAGPGQHWARLNRMTSNSSTSRWPPVLRWLDALSLDGLERLVLRSERLQRFVIGTHKRAFRSLLSEAPDVQRVGIVGGGLFPRTAIILRELLPDAELVVIDMSGRNLDTAGRFLPDNIKQEHAAFDLQTHSDFDLLVFPLAFRGDRDTLYDQPPARYVFIHDWLWHRSSRTVLVSRLLLKRLNLVVR